MELIQTQYPLANISADSSRTGLIVLILMIGAGIVLGTYLIQSRNYGKKDVAG